MIDRVGDLVGDRPAALAVQHVANPQGALDVAGALAERLPSCEPAVVTDQGPTLALHVGAGAIAVCVDLDPGGAPGAAGF
jgi:fatty acid-binding protein DegV